MTPAPISRRNAIARLAAWSALLSAGPRVFAQAAAGRRAKVLFFSKSSDYEHSVIKHVGGKPGLAERVLQQIGAENNIEVVLSKDGSLFSPDYLAQFDGFIFYTTGVLTARGKDGNPPMTEAGKAAFLRAIARGKGFIGLHAAADTFHTGETATTNTAGDRESRYHLYGDAVDPYVAMLGAEFIRHGKQQPSTLRVVDPNFPGMSGLGREKRLTEEWYSLKDFRKDLHVILVQDTAGMEGNPYHRAPYPETWARKHHRGRVFYTSLGHRDDVWNGDWYHDILRGALSWTLGRVDADVTPNLAEVAPDANQLPPMEPPKLTT